MSRFVNLIVRERVDGAPGFMAEEEFEVTVNLDEITLINKGQADPKITFVRLSCGATLAVVMKFEKFMQLLSTER